MSTAAHREHYIKLPGATIRVLDIHASDADPIVLLHGYPESLEAWRFVTPLLAAKHRLIAMDLRGYGKSSKPQGNAGLDLGMMAQDVRDVLDHFGLKRVFIAGHDRGGHVARRFVLSYPERAKGLSLIDILPVEYIYDKMTAAEVAKKFWHWVWLVTPDEPKKLVAGREKDFLEDKFKHSPGLLETLRRDGSWQIYEDAFRAGGMHAMFNNYQATFAIDLPYYREQNKKGKILQVPTQLIWGATGNLEHLPVKEIWRPVADIREGQQLECGHFVPEEKGEEAAAHIGRFCRALA